LVQNWLLDDVAYTKFAVGGGSGLRWVVVWGWVGVMAAVAVRPVAVLSWVAAVGLGVVAGWAGSADLGRPVGVVGCPRSLGLLGGGGLVGGVGGRGCPMPDGGRGRLPGR
jgi:hypothetical protein